MNLHVCTLYNLFKFTCCPKVATVGLETFAKHALRGHDWMHFAHRP